MASLARKRGLASDQPQGGRFGTASMDRQLCIHLDQLGLVLREQEMSGGNTGDAEAAPPVPRTDPGLVDHWREQPAGRQFHQQHALAARQLRREVLIPRSSRTATGRILHEEHIVGIVVKRHGPVDGNRKGGRPVGTEQVLELAYRVGYRPPGYGAAANLSSITTIPAAAGAVTHTRRALPAASVCPGPTTPSTVTV